MPDTPTRRLDYTLFALALGLLALFWGRFALLALTTASPPRQVRFEAAEGAPAEKDLNCHGTALVDGARIWQVCDFDPPGEGNYEEWLVRFELAPSRGPRAPATGSPPRRGSRTAIS
jgi:hypothetical protein